MKQQLVCLLTLLALSGCAGLKENEKEHIGKVELPVKTVNETPSPEVQHAAIEHDADYVTELRFQKGSVELSPQSQKKLTQMLARVQKEKVKIGDVKVISWADRNYTSDQASDLPSADQNLAEKRNEAISTFIKKYREKHQLDAIKLEVYNMAKKPSQWQKMWGSDDTKMKKSLEESGLTKDRKTAADSRVSTAMVMVMTEGKAKK